MKAFLPALAIVASLACTAPAHGADAYPVRQIRLVVPYAPGGNTDVMARLIAQGLSRSLGQQVVTENKPGGNTLIGTEQVARAPADGYTLLLTTLTFAVVPSLYRKLPFDPLRDFTPITLAVTLPNVLVVNPEVPAKSLAEFVAYAKANPGRMSYASTGSGTSPHLSMELMKSMAGIDLVHVPYKGGAPALTDLIGGQVAAQFIGLPVALQYVASGKLRALAVTGARRAQAAPAIPAMAETLPGYEMDAWFGVLGPARLPPAITARLRDEIARNLLAPETRENLMGLGAEPVATSSEQFATQLKAEIARYAQVVKAAGIRIE